MDVTPSRKRAKAPGSVAAQRFPALIVSSHAGGHWFESSSLHHIWKIRTSSPLGMRSDFSFLSKVIPAAIYARRMEESSGRIFFYIGFRPFLPLPWLCRIIGRRSRRASRDPSRRLRNISPAPPAAGPAAATKAGTAPAAEGSGMHSRRYP